MVRHRRGHERDEGVAAARRIELQRLAAGFLGLARAEAQRLPHGGERCEGVLDVLALRQRQRGEQDEGEVH